MDQTSLEKEVVKYLNSYQKNYCIKGEGEGETSDIHDSLKQFKESEKEVQQLLKSGDKNYQKTMEEARTNGKRGFYLLEYLVYWCMIHKEKIEPLNSVNHLSAKELEAMKVVLAEILAVKEEMIRRCVAGKISNIRLNDTAISEVIGRLPAKLYNVDYYITMIEKAMPEKEHEEHKEHKEHENPQEVVIQLLPPSCQAELHKKFMERNQGETNKMDPPLQPENKQNKMDSSFQQKPNILKRGTNFIRSKILVNKKYKVAKIAAKQEQTPKNRQIIRFMENDEIVSTSPQEPKSLKKTKDSIKFFPVNKKYEVAEAENAAKQEQTPKNMKNIKAIKTMPSQTQNVTNKERNKVHQVFIHSH